jgi:hypothetical protein
MTRRRPDIVELLLLSACAAVLVIQLFIPPSVGLADNGDFSRVYEVFSLAHIRGVDDNFAYFAPRYWFPPDNARRSGFPSSEMALAAPPIWIPRVLGRRIFDIRWLGALHAALFLAAFFLLLRYLRPWPPWSRILLGAAAIWIFGDVAYVAYCNSFFADTAAVAGVLLMVPLALRAALDKRPGEGTLLLLAISALLFIASKPQHAAVGLIPAVMVLWVLRRRLLAALLIFSLWGVVTLASPEIRARPVFNLIFLKIARQSPTPERDLAELGLGPQDVRYIGMHADQPGSPFNDPTWRADFLERTGAGKVAWFYARHPVKTLLILASDLHLEAFHIRPPDLGNFQREEGLPPGTRERHFNSWSVVRTLLYVWWWWHMAVWYALFFGGALWVSRTSRTARIAVGIGAMAVGEFAIASLADASETSRHLLLFHLLTDVTIFMTLGWLLSLVLARASRRGTAAAGNDLLPASS